MTSAKQAVWDMNNSQMVGSLGIPMGIHESLSNDANLQQSLISKPMFHKSCLNELIQVNREGKQPHEAAEGEAHASLAKTKMMHDSSTCNSSLAGGALSSVSLL